MNTIGKVLVATAGLALVAAAQFAQAQIKDPDETLRVTFVMNCCEGNPFWEPLLLGAREAAKLHNIDVDFQNADNDIERLGDLLETATANKVDGIVVTVPVEDALNQAIQEARDAGISVMTANQDPGGTARIAYVGSDLFGSAYAVTKRMVEKGGIKAGDHCVIPAHDPALAHITARIQGVLAALGEVGATGETIHTGLVIDETISTIAEYLVGHPDTDCVASTGTQGTVPAALEEAGMEGLPNSEIDVNPRALANLKEGKTIAVADQQPFWQGFLPIVYIAYNVRYGLIPGDMDTSGGMVEQHNAALAETYAGTYR